MATQLNKLKTRKCRKREIRERIWDRERNTDYMCFTPAGLANSKLLFSLLLTLPLSHSLSFFLFLYLSLDLPLTLSFSLAHCRHLSQHWHNKTFSAHYSFVLQVSHSAFIDAFGSFAYLRPRCMRQMQRCRCFASPHLTSLCFGHFASFGPTNMQRVHRWKTSCRLTVTA